MFTRGYSAHIPNICRLLPWFWLISLTAPPVWLFRRMKPWFFGGFNCHPSSCERPSWVNFEPFFLRRDIYLRLWMIPCPTHWSNDFWTRPSLFFSRCWDGFFRHGTPRLPARCKCPWAPLIGVPPPGKLDEHRSRARPSFGFGRFLGYDKNNLRPNKSKFERARKTDGLWGSFQPNSGTFSSVFQSSWLLSWEEWWWWRRRRWWWWRWWWWRWW